MFHDTMRINEACSKNIITKRWEQTTMMFNVLFVEIHRQSTLIARILAWVNLIPLPVAL